MRGLFQDVKFALRMMAKNPGFTLVVVLTLALGIGVNSAGFTLAKDHRFLPNQYFLVFQPAK